MERSIFISSKNRDAGVSENYKVNFYPVFNLDENYRWMMALTKLSMTYSWYNVSASNNNNTLKYSKDSGSSWTTVTFPDGIYSYRDLQTYLNDDKIKFVLLYTRHKLMIELESGYQLDLRDGEFSNLLGFEKKLLTSTSIGTLTPNITNSIDNIHICVNKIRGFNPVDSRLVDTLFSFSTGNLRRGLNFEKEPIHPSFVPVKDLYFDSLMVHVRDDQGNLIDLNNIDWSMTIVLKPWEY